MIRFFLIVLCSLPLFVGCGNDVEPMANRSTISSSEKKESQALVNSPTDVVSQFLDEVRRGGEDSLAQSLLTRKAQSELQRIGQTVQPIGSPDASFQVTRAESVPNEPGSALVHSLWIEPNSTGSKTTNQVVWAVEQEDRYWRISGLVIAVEESQSPVVLDFENGDMMAQLLTGSQPAKRTEAGETKAAASGSSVNR
ncbi:MAG: hypothetical protein VXZ38_00250 [Planctomycetota bacterium]|nr:hypothetical protein [Planctomycetota bacterium]